MHAMAYRGGALVVEERAQPTPGPMQVLARVRACGVCGSDLHAVQYADQRPGGLEGVVMGHEFVAEIMAAGPGAEAWTPGTRVVCSPHIVVPDETVAEPPHGQPADTNLFFSNRAQLIGYNPRYPGGFGEYLLLSTEVLVPVPAHVPDRLAATVEPCAVGLHAVKAGAVQPDEPVLVMGAGPIGLMTLLWLKRAGVRHVTVSERAAPRRALAARLGADRVLDPAADDFQAQLAAGAPPRVVFECVGVPGTLQEAISHVARQGRVIVVGVCSTTDQIMPAMGIGKHLTLQFVLAYTAAEIAEALAAISDGSLNPAPLVTRTVTLDELPAAFFALSDPQECKVLVEFPEA